MAKRHLKVRLNSRKMQEVAQEMALVIVKHFRSGQDEDTAANSLACAALLVAAMCKAANVTLEDFVHGAKSLQAEMLDVEARSTVN